MINGKLLPLAIPGVCEFGGGKWVAAVGVSVMAVGVSVMAVGVSVMAVGVR